MTHPILLSSLLLVSCVPAAPAEAATADSPLLTARAEKMAARHLRLWEDAAARGDELGQLRGMNPEWDFMGRTFLTLALASMALDNPAREAELLPVMDRMIADTLAYEAQHGQAGYLMAYAAYKPWINPDSRSLFVDGELALMMGARRMVEDDGRWDEEHARRIAYATDLIAGSPALMGESYPDEAWMFCNTVALAAIRIYDHLEPEADHSDLLQRWLAHARAHHIEPETGLLISSMTWDGTPKDGPEGSSIWLSAHMLQFIDPELAETQYVRARRQLGRTLLGLGYALEWPPSQPAPLDVDAGEIVPVLGASTSSSGLAIIAARSFRDDVWHAALLRSLDWTAGPTEEDGTLAYARSNQVGDAVILYGLVEGPLRAALLSPR